MRVFLNLAIIPIAIVFISLAIWQSELFYLPTAASNLSSDLSLTGSQTILISEVEYNTRQPGINQHAYEWFELFNPTTHAITLTNWTISDGSMVLSNTIPSSSDTIPTVVVPAGQAVVVAASINFTVNYPTFKGVIVYLSDSTIGSNGLQNNSDHLILRNDMGTVIDVISWGLDTIAFTPSLPNVPAGHSLERCPINVDTNSAADFINQGQPSPGTANVSCLERPATSTPTATATPSSTKTATLSPSPSSTGTIIPQPPVKTPEPPVSTATPGHSHPPIPIASSSPQNLTTPSSTSVLWLNTPILPTLRPSPLPATPQLTPETVTGSSIPAETMTPVGIATPAATPLPVITNRATPLRLPLTIPSRNSRPVLPETSSASLIVDGIALQFALQGMPARVGPDEVAQLLIRVTHTGSRPAEQVMVLLSIMSPLVVVRASTDQGLVQVYPTHLLIQLGRVEPNTELKALIEIQALPQTLPKVIQSCAQLAFQGGGPAHTCTYFELVTQSTSAQSTSIATLTNSLTSIFHNTIMMAKVSSNLDFWPRDMGRQYLMIPIIRWMGGFLASIGAIILMRYAFYSQ